MRGLVLGLVVLCACGDDSADADAGRVDASVDGALDGGTDVGPPELGSVITRVDVGPPASGAASSIVTFAQAFRPGDVMTTVVGRVGGEGGTLLPTQVDVKRRHPDGSVRHALVALDLGSAPTTTQTIELVSADAAAQPGTALDALLAGGLDLDVEITLGGTTYTLDAADALRDGATRWSEGPLVNAFRASGLASGPSGLRELLVLFDVSFFGPEGARVRVGVENAFTDARADRTYDVRVLADGAPIFEQTGLVHHHHARWSLTHVWGDAAPNAHVAPELGYLAEVGVVPKYDARTVPEATIAGLASSFAGSSTGPLGNGIVIEYFPTTGGRQDIGPLPGWTAIALISGDARAHAVMNGTGELAASFSVHYRDRDSGRLLSIDEHPTVTLNSSAARYSDEADMLPDCDPCSSPYTVDQAHQPSLAFVPYLLTGDPWFLDELYFWTNHNFISQNFDYRGRERGHLHSNQVRAQAWSLRTLAHAAWIAPDGDPEQAYFEDKLAENLTWYQENAVDSNPLGWWGRQSNSGSDGGRPDENMAPDVRYYTSPWMSDFLVWAFDLIDALGWDGAAPVRDWLAAYTVARFTSGPDYDPWDGAPYHMAVELEDGTQLTDWATIYEKSFAGRSGPAPTEFNSGCSLCYDSIARVALIGALHGGLPNAEAAYDFVNAGLQPNPARYDEDPTWAIVP